MHVIPQARGLSKERCDECVARSIGHRFAKIKGNSASPTSDSTKEQAFTVIKVKFPCVLAFANDSMDNCLQSCFGIANLEH
jgi:hypothetical protein